MDSKRTNRRDLLKGGAAAAGGLAALGATPASAQLSPYGTPLHDNMASGMAASDMPMVTPDKTPMIHGQQGADRIRPALQLRDLRAHGAPDGRQAVTRRVRQGVPRGHAVAGFRWRDHAIVAALCRDDPRLLSAGHRSQAAHADDPRPGRSAADLHHGRLEALPVGHPVAFHRVCGKPARWAAKDRAGIARDDQLLRMDRRAAFHAAQGMRPERQRDMVRR